MDLLSHTLMGSLVASIGLQKKYGAVASATMIAANLLPDIDGTAMALGPKYFFLYHRHPLTHSLGGAFVLSAALTAVVSLATSFKRPGLVFLISFIGVVLHLLSDLLTPWPIPILWPFSARTYSFDLINFLDPFLLALLVGSFSSVRHWPARGLLFGILTIAIALGYLGFRLYGQGTALNIVRERSSSQEITTLPHGLSLTNWDVITREQQGYALYIVDALRRDMQGPQIFHSVSDERIPIIAGKSDLVQAFLKRARFPLVRTTEMGTLTTIEWLDVHLITSGGAINGVKVTINDQGEIVEEKFIFNSRR